MINLINRLSLKLLVNVKRVRHKAFINSDPQSITYMFFESWYTLVPIEAPNVRPAYTIVPSDPNPKLSVSNFFITSGAHPGRLP